MLPTGRVQFLPLNDYEGQDGSAHVTVSRLNGRSRRIHARHALVDARYLEAAIPAHRPPPFSVAPGMRVIPPNALPDIAQAPSGFTVIGAGKTAMDAVIWLLDQGIAPESIRWIRPRDPWLSDRGCLQALELAVGTIACGARSTEAAAQARDVAAPCSWSPHCLGRRPIPPGGDDDADIRSPHHRPRGTVARSPPCAPRPRCTAHDLA
jgi:hypothetical protein